VADGSESEHLRPIREEQVIVHQVAKKLLDVTPKIFSLKLWMSGNASSDLPILTVNQMDKDAARAGPA
jgi:hypothetical protein